MVKDNILKNSFINYSVRHNMSWPQNVRCTFLCTPSQMLFTRSVWSVKPKFHYADFATMSGTSSWKSRGLVADTNHERSRHKSHHRLSWFVSATLSGTCYGLCRQLSPCIVMDQIPLERHKRVCRGLVTDFVTNISTCQDDLCPWLSWFVSVTFTETLWLHDLSPFVSAAFVICVHDFPRREVLVKVGVMEFGLKTLVGSTDALSRWLGRQLILYSDVIRSFDEDCHSFQSAASVCVSVGSVV